MSVDFTNADNASSVNPSDNLLENDIASSESLTNPLESEYITRLCSTDGRDTIGEIAQMTSDEADELESLSSLPDVDIDDLADDETLLAEEDGEIEDDIAELDKVNGQYDANGSAPQSEMAEVARYNARAVGEKLQNKLKYERELEESRQQNLI